MRPEEKVKELIKLKEQCFSCSKCGLNNNIINGYTPYCFGYGNPSARLMFVAEAPGKNEAEQKKPLVGDAGKNFNKMLQVLRLYRKEIYISNTVKCRPVDGKRNRAPTEEEKISCKHFLKQEIEIIQPRLVITLGNHSLEFFTGHQGITRSHGVVETSGEFGVNVFPTYHPSSFNFRNRERLQEISGDMKVLKALIDAKEWRIESLHNIESKFIDKHNDRARKRGTRLSFPK